MDKEIEALGNLLVHCGLATLAKCQLDKEIEALGNLLVQLPNEKFYVLSAVVVVALMTMAFVLRNYRKK